VGLNVEFYRGFQSGIPKVLTSPLDLLCRQAVEEDNIRTGVWGEKFEDWIPLVLNRQHGQMAKDTILRKFQELCPPDRFSKERGAKLRRADSLLYVMGCLMNQMVVSIVEDKKTQSFNEWDDVEGDAIKPTLCEKALLGYCSFHHMLLFLAEQYPEMVTLANRRVNSFLAKPGHRHKEHTRNLGIWLINLCLSEKTFEDVANCFEEEALTRSVMWTLRSDPGLTRGKFDTVQQTQSRMKKNITKYWESAAVGRRLIMFQVWFMRNVGRPNGAHWMEILKGYDSRMGAPDTRVQREIFGTVKRICGISEWPAYFQLLGIKSGQTVESVARRIMYCYDRSDAQGYTGSKRVRSDGRKGRPGRFGKRW